MIPAESQAVTDRKKSTDAAQGERYELPEGWAWAPLGSLIELNYGKGLPARSRNHSGNIPVYGSNGIVGHHDRSLATPPVIIVGRKGSVGEVHISHTPCWPIDTTYFVDTLPSALDAKFLFRYLASQRIADLDRSTAIPGINREDLYRMPLPVPPLNEQRRIAAKIDALFEQSRTARQALDRIPPLLKKFRQSVLAAAFRGDLTRDWREQDPDIEPASALLERIRAARRRKREEDLCAKGKEPQKATYEAPKLVDTSDLPELPEGWVWCTLQECTTLITKGESPKWQGYQYVADGVPFVRSENVLWGALDFSNVARIPSAFHHKLQRSRLQPNDVLINLVGASIGRCAIVPHELREANINQAVATIRTTEALSPFYLLYLLLSPGMQRVIQGKKVEVARPNISLGDLSALIIPLAPFAEQHHIVSTVAELFARVAPIEAAGEAARRRADNLEQSILARSFRGELVPQRPSDEPASVVLDRIREEHSGNMTHRRRRIEHPR